MTTNRRSSARRIAGFTLVEILIVIVIIGLLAGMTTTVLVSARRSVSNAVVSTQMAQLSIALDQYKNKFGEYPPDLSDKVAVERHLKKRWPRYNVNYATFLDHISYGCEISSQKWAAGDTLSAVPTGTGSHVWKMGDNSSDNLPCIAAHLSSLVFWLGGLPDENGVPSGFYASPKYPLGVNADGDPISRPGRAKREKPFFTFERKNLAAFDYETDSELYDKRTNSNGAYVYKEVSQKSGEYIPGYCQGGFPILYFRPSVTDGYANKYFYLQTDDGLSCAVPYAQNNVGPVWYEEQRFQLIHPGSDGLFGLPVDSNDPTSTDYSAWRSVPNKVNTSLEDADNIVNFIDNGTLESLYD